MTHACQRFCNVHKTLRLPRNLQSLRFLAPATKSDLLEAPITPAPPLGVVGQPTTSSHRRITFQAATNQQPQENSSSMNNNTRKTAANQRPQQYPTRDTRSSSISSNSSTSKAVGKQQPSSSTKYQRQQQQQKQQQSTSSNSSSNTTAKKSFGTNPVPPSYRVDLNRGASQNHRRQEEGSFAEGGGYPWWARWVVGLEKCVAGFKKKATRLKK